MTATEEMIETEAPAATGAQPAKTFPLTYGGIVVYNMLEYTMLDELSIRMLRWLSENGNLLAERLVHDIDEMDATKREMTDDYAKNLVKVTGNGLEDNRKAISESIKRRIEEIQKHKLHIIPDFGCVVEEDVEDVEEVTHSLFEGMGDMFEFEDDRI